GEFPGAGGQAGPVVPQLFRLELHDEFQRRRARSGARSLRPGARDFRRQDGRVARGGIDPDLGGAQGARAAGTCRLDQEAQRTGLTCLQMPSDAAQSAARLHEGNMILSVRAFTAVVIALGLTVVAAPAPADEPTLIRVNTFPNAKALPLHAGIAKGIFE